MDIEPTTSEPSSLRNVALFEDRYGHGAHDRLVALLRQPCITFAEIANRFGVTRECVRQWHQRLLPDAPTGHARQRLCRASQLKHRLLGDPLFQGFYRHVREDLPGRRLTLFPARDGFRKRSAAIDGYTIALKKARLLKDERDGDGRSYALLNAAAHVDFLYFELTASEYLLIPRGMLTAKATTFTDTPGSKYQPYKNSFAAYDRARDYGRAGSRCADPSP